MTRMIEPKRLPSQAARPSVAQTTVLGALAALSLSLSGAASEVARAGESATSPTRTGVVTLLQLHDLKEGSHQVLGRTDGGVVFFVADSRGTQRQRRIMRTDGTVEGTFEIFGHPGPGGHLVVGEWLLWGARNGDTLEVWASDGSREQTSRLFVSEGSPLNGPFPFYRARQSATSPRGEALFVREDSWYEEPWITDGTPGGTRVLLPTEPGTRVARMAAGRDHAFVLLEERSVFRLLRVGYDGEETTLLEDGAKFDYGPAMVLVGEQLVLLKPSTSVGGDSRVLRSVGGSSEVRVVDILPPGRWALASAFVDPHVYFVVVDGSRDYSEPPRSLWRTTIDGPAEKVLDLGEESEILGLDELVLVVDSTVFEGLRRLLSLRPGGVVEVLAHCEPQCGWSSNLGRTGSTFQFLLWEMSKRARAFATDGTTVGTREVWSGVPDPLRRSNSLTFGQGDSLFLLGPRSARRVDLALERLSEGGRTQIHNFGPDVAVNGGAYTIEDDGPAVFSVSSQQGESSLYSLVSTLAPCSPTASVLCLGGDRFEVEVEWTDFSGGSGAGRARPLTEDTGSFWFFAEDNLELVVKVIDGTPLNDHHWVFYGSLSDVGYRMTVTDTSTGRRRVYTNPPGTFASQGDITALRGDVTEARPKSGSTLRPDGPGSKTVSLSVGSSRDAARRRVMGVASTCGLPEALCLGGRFSVRVRWTDFQGGAGGGSPLELTSDTGAFWFFDQENIELVVKVLDGRTVNGKFWFFYGALSNVAYEIEVLDTETGVVRTYSNPAGNFGSRGDTAAFDG